MIDFVKSNKDEILKSIILNNPKYDWLDLDYYELISIDVNNQVLYFPVFFKPFDIDIIVVNVCDNNIIGQLSCFLYKLFKKVINLSYIDLINENEYKNKRSLSVKCYLKHLFDYAIDEENYYIKFLAKIYTIKKRNTNLLLEINNKTKCLMVCPHPDDEILGAGALMIKYSNNFDCICLCSSGISDNDDINEAMLKSDIRVKEFKSVMDYIGIKAYWIFEIYGTYYRFDKEMLEMLDKYCSVLSNLKKYDYIFLPHPSDGHHEHRFITNKLFKKVIKKVGINPNTKIVFYEVWKDMKSPNVFFDISKEGVLYSKNGYKKYRKSYSKLLNTTNETLLELKYKILKMYKSQFTNTSIFAIQTMKTKCLNNGRNPIWRFKVIPIEKYK